MTIEELSKNFHNRYFAKLFINDSGSSFPPIWEADSMVEHRRAVVDTFQELCNEGVIVVA